MTDFAITTLMRNPALNAEGDDVGRVSDVLLRANGEVSAVVLQLGGVLGVGSRQVAVPFDQCRIDWSDAGPFVRLPSLKAGEVIVAAEYAPADGTALERFAEQAGALSQAAASKAAEMGQSISHAAGELADEIARRANPADANSESLVEPPANDATAEAR